MAETDDEAQRLAEITKRAAAIAALVPEHLQVAAFNRAFDELSGDSQPPPSDRKKSRSSSKRAPAKPAAVDIEGEKADPAQVLIENLSRPDHPEIMNATTGLDKALHLLRVAESDHGIGGLSATAIAKVLTEKFRWRVSHQAIRQALDRAGNLVDRVPQKQGGTLYRLMQPGEEYLDRGGAEAVVAPRARSSKKGARKSGARKKTATKTRGAPSAGGTEGSSRSRKRATRGPKGYIADLIAEGFFDEPRAIGAIQERLRHKKGVRLKATDLSPALVRLLREGKLDRERGENNQYEYSVTS